MAGVDNELYNRPGDIWWDEDEVLSLLRVCINPARFGYFRAILTRSLGLDPAGLAALDVGCGGGILAEEFARLGCRVTGVDPSASSLETARAHARQSGLDIAYRQAAGEDLPFPDASFEVVYCCDVLEHVADLDRVIAETARVLKPGGVFLYDTINRTPASKLVVIKLLQEWRWSRLMPPNFHAWRQFITPAELIALLATHGLENRAIAGMKPRANPAALFALLIKYKRGAITLGELGRRAVFARSENTAISYMGYAIKR